MEDGNGLIAGQGFYCRGIKEGGNSMPKSWAIWSVRLLFGMAVPFLLYKFIF
jgi:hypothetical protein